jgi:hypothetical protein
LPSWESHPSFLVAGLLYATFFLLLSGFTTGGVV